LYSVRISVQTEQRLTCNLKTVTVICATPVFLSGKGVSSDISLLSNTICACAIFTVEMTKLWNLVQKKKFGSAGACKWHAACWPHLQVIYRINWRTQSHGCERLV